MEILNHQLPPNYDKLNAAFNLDNHAVLFCWGNFIYNPVGVSIPIQLIKHEEVHSKQQGQEVEAWWDRYLVDVPFRFSQELPAHRVEWDEYCKRHGDRKKRNEYLTLVAMRLSSSLYGSMKSLAEAKDKILTYKI